MVAPSFPRSRVLLCLLALAIAAPSLLPAAATSSSAPDIDRSEYHARRLALAAELRKELPAGGTGVLVLHGAPEPDNATYRQESNLYYLTGTEIPGSTLVLAFDAPESGGKGSRRLPKSKTSHVVEYFYLPERDYRAERWTGAKPGAGGLVKETLEPDAERREAMKATGFESIPESDYPSRAFPRGPIQRAADLQRHLNLFLGMAAVLFHQADAVPLGEALSSDLAFLREVRDHYPLLPVKNPEKALGRLRMIKSPSEIGLLRRAIEISCRAQLDAVEQARPGMPEYEIQAIIEKRFTSSGARRPGYPSIVGSGPNSCVLHYDASERTGEQEDLLLMDVGAEYKRYTADVTRTIPLSGRFTPEQRKIYEIVLRAQKAAIAAIRPGVPFVDIHKTARKVIEEAGYGSQFFHGTSHFLGLDVHDAGDTSATLRAGMVLTVEPGIYIPEKRIGVRIEDDVLVTPDGAELLSGCAPREADAVETQMTEGLKSGSR